jgi:hypothetical protein
LSISAFINLRCFYQTIHDTRFGLLDMYIKTNNKGRPKKCVAECSIRSKQRNSTALRKECSKPEMKHAIQFKNL